MEQKEIIEVIKDLRDCPEHSTSKWHVDICANRLIKKLETKQLNLHNVSQQRELLAFRKWQKDNWKDVYLHSDEFMISEFKKANCG